MTVFANGLEISAKAQGCKLVAAIPDVCMTPPQTPATPPGVPIPYPNFGMDSDLTSGSTMVKIGGQPVSMENKSNYKKCSGDEAGCAPKKGVVTSNKAGPVYAQAWSMDVKVEGKGVVRFGDIATSNHGCNPGQPAPMPLIGKPGADAPPGGAKCIVGEYEEKRAECSANKTNPPPPAEPQPFQFHHIVPDRTYRRGRKRVKGLKKPRDLRQKFGPSRGKGICICLPPDNHVGSKQSAPGSAVHQELDNALTKLGQATDIPSSPAGCAELSTVRVQCVAALAKLVPKVLSKECYKLAVEEVMKQTEPNKHKQVRAEKSLKKLSSRARRKLARQR